MPDLDDAAGVRTHYEEHGVGDPVVLLHGGLAGGDQWQFAVEPLGRRFRVLVPDRRGHGRTPDVEGPYSYEAMAEETIAFLEQVLSEPVHLVGYSDGGITALHVALRRPDLVRDMVVIGTNFHVDGLLPAVREGMSAEPDPDAEELAGLREAHVASSPDGTAGWPVVLAKVMQMSTSGPTLTSDDLRRITARTLVVAADDDIIDHAHTVTLFETVPDARLAVVPGTSHALPDEQPDEVLRLVTDFLSGQPVTRLIPLRKAN
jgi:pimeloyl-ACP methyl ester carboxylesterase